jgi:hypothetical protein
VAKDEEQKSSRRAGGKHSNGSGKAMKNGVLREYEVFDGKDRTFRDGYNTAVDGGAGTQTTEPQQPHSNTHAG